MLNRRKYNKIRRLDQSSYTECAQKAGLVGRGKVEEEKGKS